MSERYCRQLPLLGAAGQEALAGASVFVAGAGGLGSPVLFYLAAAGAGTLRVADLDVIDESNLNRQILHPASRLGTSKAESAKKTLEALNPDCHVTAFTERIDDESALRLIGAADLIVDCMDNFAARYVLNRASRAADIPLLHGAVAGFSGQMTLIIPHETPCLACIFPGAETAGSTPVLGAAAGVVGSMQAMEAVRYLTGKPTLAGKLLLYDGAVNSIDVFTVKKSNRCPVCGGQ